MFSRKCDGCDEQHPGNNQGLLRFQGQAEMRPHVYDDCIDTIPPPREYPTMNGPYPRVIRPAPQQLSRLNETSGEFRSNYENNNLYDRPRCRNDFQSRRNHVYSTEEEDVRAPDLYNHDPFRNWAFNFDDNTFKPATGRPETDKNQSSRDVRRITDGTFPKKETSPPPASSSSEPIPGTSRTESDSACSSQSGSISSVVQLPLNATNEKTASVLVHQQQQQEQNENTESYASNRSNSSSNENDDDRSSIVMSDNDQ